MTKNSKKNAPIMDENQVEHNPETTLAEEQNQESSLSTASDTESGTEDETEGDLEKGDTEENLVDSTSPAPPPETEEPQGLAVPQMQRAAYAMPLGQDNQHYLLCSDSTGFLEISAHIVSSSVEQFDIQELRDEMTEFNELDAKELVQDRGEQGALDYAKSEFAIFHTKIARVGNFAEGCLFYLRLEQSKALEKLKEICREAEFDFNLKVVQTMPQIGLRSLKDYERLLKYKDIFDFIPIGKNRAVSLIAVIEKDAGKGARKARAWQGDTPLKDYLEKGGVIIPNSDSDQSLEIFKFETDLLINTRRVEHEHIEITEDLLNEFTKECGELKRSYLKDLEQFSGDEEALKIRLEEYKANDGKIPPNESAPNKMEGVIKRIDGILSSEDALETVTQETVDVLKAKVAELEQKLASNV
ncbi:hypothetical protein SAMN02745216_03878 [Desulfatibacillum alkenivorans DSM 16219]|jgi:hypothetical protein|uniref:Uncharacterized protein n=1 Tax=Desulfatibacillum alkenivorans DSM 16219 TaxID=1121393 RepID=A0A1M6UE41_9BACT|nr:hypothetical protein [Desulfatibacillum alkenivorans]SHK67446.1 hypothetical protein SAMN02745216_03878 [Desulfatibacillum alkenivorans DSM 16219]